MIAAGGDAAEGRAVYDANCTSCHGGDGQVLLIDGEYTLGSHVRQKSYEDHHKFVYGQPGTAMGASDLNETQQLALLALFCDVTQFPAGGDMANPDKERLACAHYESN